MFWFIKLLIVSSVLTQFALNAAVMASEGTSDYKWVQFNLMRSQDAKIPFGAKNDTYLEME